MPQLERVGVISKEALFNNTMRSSLEINGVKEQTIFQASTERLANPNGKGETLKNLKVVMYNAPFEIEQALADVELIRQNCPRAAIVVIDATDGRAEQLEAAGASKVWMANSPTFEQDYQRLVQEYLLTPQAA